MDFAETVSVFVSGILAGCVTDRLVFVAPLRESVVDDILIGINQRARFNHRTQDRFDGLALDIREHEDGYIPGSLNDSQNRRLLFLESAASRCTFESTTPCRPILATHSFGMSFVASPDVDFVALHCPLQFTTWFSYTDFLAQSHGHDVGDVRIKLQLCSDLAIGHVEAHEIEHDDPDTDRMMLVCQDRSGKIIEATTAVVALVPLAKWVRTLVSVLLDTIRCAFETTNTMGPSSQSEEIVALLAIDKVVNSDIQFWHGCGNHEASF